MQLPTILPGPRDSRGSRPDNATGPAIEPALADLLLALTLAMLTMIWFGSIGDRSLVSPDEGRYATISWAMAQSGDWVTPRLNGLLYFEKPPLQYWIGAIFFHLFGFNAFAARLWPALASFLTVLMVGYTGSRLWGRETGLRCFGIAAAMTWIFFNGHFLTLDAGLTLFLSISLCAVLIARFADPLPTSPRNWIWLAWAAMAGAVLSKGLVGILIPGAVLVIASLWRRDASLWRGMHWASGLLILFALAAPWFVLVSMRNPSFAEFFFIHEHFARYLTTEHNRTGAWWYYLPVLLIGMLPWTGALPWLWRPAARVGSDAAKLRADAAAGQVSPRAADRAGSRGRVAAADLLLVWPVFILLFFSLSGSKLPSYILPMFPALALLIGLRMRDARIEVLRRHLWLPVALCVPALLAPTLIRGFQSNAISLDELLRLGAGIRAGAVVFLVAAALAWWCLGRRQLTSAVLAIALGQTAAMALVFQSLDCVSRHRSSEAMVAAVKPLIGVHTPVFAVQTYDQSLPFYLGRELTLVDYHDEFALGQESEPGRSLDSLDDFIARWNALPQAAAYMSTGTFHRLQLLQLPMRIAYQDRSRMLVVKH